MTNFKPAKNAPIYTRIRVPQHYHRQPVISRLISRYGLSVNIKAASLTVGADNCGWFDLELQGKSEQLVSSLSYLQGIGVDLMQVAIADIIQPDQDSEPFPISDRNPIQSEYTAFASAGEAQIYPQISSTQTNRLRLQVCISKTYYHQPVISELVSRYGVTINITAALLQPDMQNDGWFDLELWGRSEQLFSSVGYLQNIGCW